MWTPSADSAARIVTSGAIEVNGTALPAGSYSVWAIPDSTNWTVIFNSNAVRFHLNVPTSGEVMRVQAHPTTGSHVETLQFSFPMVDADSARLELHWGPTIIPLSIKAPH
jgi:hypothetical protein